MVKLTESKDAKWSGCGLVKTNVALNPKARKARKANFTVSPASSQGLFSEEDEVGKRARGESGTLLDQG